MNHRGRSMQQKDKTPRCSLCKKDGHWAPNCPQKGDFANIACPRQRTRWGCKFGPACYYKHDDQGEKNKEDEDKTGINNTMQPDTSDADRASASASQMRARMALEQQEYDAGRVRVGTMSLQQYEQQYHPNQNGPPNPYYDNRGSS